MTSHPRRAAARCAARSRSPPRPACPSGPNPRVGCVLLDARAGRWPRATTAAPGTPHAEADALAVAAAAGVDVRGATAVVTLEPCNHTGRTGPCSEALLEAGVRRVVHAQADASPVAAGGAARLRAAGVEVEGGLLADEARALNRAWTFVVEHGRPFVTWKLATTLDGRSAAADGTSRWVTGRAARRDTHRLRAPVRHDAGRHRHGAGRRPAAHGPRRARRAAARTSRCARSWGCATSTPTGACSAWRDRVDDARSAPTRAPAHPRPARGAGRAVRAASGTTSSSRAGPTLAAAFLRAGLVDEVVAYVAPVLLGAGRTPSADLGITTIADGAAPRGHRRRRPGRARRRAARRPADPRPRLAPDHPADPVATRGHLMFTGIVEELGTVAAVEPTRATPSGSPSAARTCSRAPRSGDSIAVNGCCLTVAEHDGEHLHRRRDAPRRCARPRWAGSTPGGRVNLERAVTPADPPRRPRRPGPRRRHRHGALAGRPASTGRSSRSPCPRGAGPLRRPTRARSPSTGSASPSSRRATTPVHGQPDPRDAGPHHAGRRAARATGSTSRSTSSPSTSRSCVASTPRAASPPGPRPAAPGPSTAATEDEPHEQPTRSARRRRGRHRRHRRRQGRGRRRRRGPRERGRPHLRRQQGDARADGLHHPALQRRDLRADAGRRCWTGSRSR